MDEPKHFCRRCKRFGNFTTTEKLVVCPHCGEKFDSAEIINQVEGQSDQKNGCLQIGLWILLILVAIFLVALAFIYAACSQGLKNI